MNRYNNKLGYHTPKMSEDNLNKIKKGCPNIEFEDSSWHNDTCDSVLVWLDKSENDHIQIMFPNAVIEDADKEEFNSFCINRHTDKNGTEYLHELVDIDEVIKIINELLN